MDIPMDHPGFAVVDATIKEPKEYERRKGIVTPLMVRVQETFDLKLKELAQQLSLTYQQAQRFSTGVTAPVSLELTNRIIRDCRFILANGLFDIPDSVEKPQEATVATRTLPFTDDDLREDRAANEANEASEVHIRTSIPHRDPLLNVKIATAVCVVVALAMLFL